MAIELGSDYIMPNGLGGMTQFDLDRWGLGLYLHDIDMTMLTSNMVKGDLTEQRIAAFGSEEAALGVAGMFGEEGLALYMIATRPDQAELDRLENTWTLDLL